MAKITIDETLCKGCAMCVNACPKKILELAKDRINSKGYHPASMTNQEACIACCGRSFSTRAAASVPAPNENCSIRRRAANCFHFFVTFIL